MVAGGVELSEYDPRQLWLRGVDETYRGWPAPSRLAPLVRWAGGKRWILPLLGLGLHRYLANTGGRLCEPFAGGAAVSSWLGWPRTLLGDACGPLAAVYAEVVVNPEGVSDALAELAARGGSEVAYREIRRCKPASRVERAAWCLYLNRNCFNGLWRENRRGEFNVPYAHLDSPAYPSRAHVLAWADRARGWTVHAGDFAPLVEGLGAGDAVFADPPYADGTRGGFSGYVQGGWSVVDRARLAWVVGIAARRGCLVVVTDGASEAARADYAAAGLHVLSVKSRHSVGATGDRRGAAREWLAVSDQAVLS
jgi:DNA adenine methylase